MKFLILLSSIFISAIVSNAQPLYVGEFNIRNDNAKDAAAGNGWAVLFVKTVEIGKSV